MLEGIDVLNKTEILDTPAWADIVTCVAFIVALVSIALFLVNITNSYYVAGGVSICFLIVSFTFLVFLFRYEDSINTGRYRYEVTIDDNVSFLDLQEKYDVIEQNGRIWTIEDKEVEKNENYL